jgi:signal transduction histidine kinase
MTDARADAAAASGRGWGVSLAAVLAFGLIAALNATAGETDWESVGLTFAVALAYAVFFALVVRRARALSPMAYVAVGVTMIAAGVLTAVVPSNAVLQFWAFPLLWALLPHRVVAIAASFVLAAAVFGGFAVSTGHEPGWLMTSLLTEGVSFGVSIVMGLWISSVYAYGVERERLLSELTAAQDELAALHRDAGVTSERERLSRELHDTLAQSLTAAVLLVQRARREAASGEPVEETLDLVEESVRTGLGETRLLVAGNAPVELAGGGIATALETLAARFRREAGVEVDVDVRLHAPLERETETALLRCAQEAFGNIRKHAGAHRVTVVLTDDAAGAQLRVRNDGRGFDPDAAAAGFGLSGLRARLRLVGGTLELDGGEGAVELRARVPRGVVA